MCDLTFTKRTIKNKIIDLIKEKTKKNPFIFEIAYLLSKIYKFYLIRPKQDFILFHRGDVDIYFSKAPLQDTRGIGRVTRELIKQFENHNTNVSLSQKNNKKVYFYSSIHWCPFNPPKPSVIMIHDVTPLALSDYFPKPIVNEWKKKYKPLAQNADKIVTVSRSSATDISKYLSINPEKIEVVYNGVSQLDNISCEKVFDLGIDTTDYITYLGAYDFNKNLEVVLNALNFKELEDIKLVLIGDNKTYYEKAKSLRLYKKVIFTGKISDETASYIIKNSLALVFPSLYEGFGLPPFEAAKLGVPTLCSNRPAMTELLNEAAVFLDPFKPQEWVDAIKRIKKDKAYREKIASNAKERVKQFNWENSYKKLVDILVKNAI